MIIICKLNENISKIFSMLLSISLITKYLQARKPLILTNVLVEGNNYVNKDSIINTLESEYVNNSILEINFKEIKETIYKNKFIDKLKIYRQMPSTLVIEVEEVIPILKKAMEADGPSLIEFKMSLELNTSTTSISELHGI